MFGRPSRRSVSRFGIAAVVLLLGFGLPAGWAGAASVPLAPSLAGAPGLAASVAPALAGPNWSLVCPDFCAFDGAALAYDPGVHGLLLYGGSYADDGTSVYGNDTWTYSAGHWARLGAPGLPGPRVGALLAYDAADGYAVLFGGSVPCGVYPNVTLCPSNATFRFNGTAWSAVTGPGPTALPATMAYDSTAGEIVLVQELSANSTRATTTWTFRHGAWSQLAIGGPKVHSGEALAYDAADGYLVLYGGSPVGGASVENSTWKFAGKVWTNLTAHSALVPPPLTNATLFEQNGSRPLLLWGGTGLINGTAGQPNLQLWQFSAGNWSMVTTRGSNPTANVGSAAAGDPALGCVFVLGGLAAGIRTGHAWDLCGTTWKNLTLPTDPPARYGAAFAYDPTGAQVIMFGGQTGSYQYTGTWSYANGAWTQLAPTLAPTPRSFAGFAYDAGIGKLVLFGGANGTTYFNDTWEYQSGKWTHVVTAKAPPAREGATLAYDAYDGELILFGGYNGADLRDTWAFKGTSWTNLTASLSKAPSARAYAASTYDPSRNAVILYGGVNSKNATLDDTWKFYSGAWSLVPGAGKSPGVGVLSASMAFQPGLGLVILGGYNQSVPYGTTHYIGAFALLGSSGWTNLSTPPGQQPPAGRDRMAMAYDPASGTLVLFGGYEAANVYGDTWVD